MSINVRPGREVRRTPAYRAAVWCMRVSYVCVPVGAVALFVHRFGSLYFPIWLAGVAMAACSLVLLRLAGVRFNSRGIADPEIGGQFSRDLMWRPPR
jgi:hypothetical protein